MVVLTSECSSNSCSVRMSLPDSSRRRTSSGVSTVGERCSRLARTIHPARSNPRQRPICKKQQRRYGLPLGRRRYLPCHRQPGQKRRHLRRPHLPRMPFAVKQHEALDPIGISLFGTQAVMTWPQRFPYLLHSSRGWRAWVFVVPVVAMYAPLC